MVAPHAGKVGGLATVAGAGKPSKKLGRVTPKMGERGGGRKRTFAHFGQDTEKRLEKEFGGRFSQAVGLNVELAKSMLVAIGETVDAASKQKMQRFQQGYLNRHFGLNKWGSSFRKAKLQESESE
jgi:hypothetical protein